jgi:superfamily II DNA or RNA helicase
MKQKFKGWPAVGQQLRQEANRQRAIASEQGEAATHLNEGQRASLHAIATRIEKNGMVIADEVGMGKTRIAVELARCVVNCGGRVAVLVPPGLGYQWKSELQDGKLNDVPAVLRSMKGFLDVWAEENVAQHQPWFDQPVVLLSHAMTNWRMGGSTNSFRWSLAPELYAQWRKTSGLRLPRGYNLNQSLEYAAPYRAAISICKSVPKNRRHPIRKRLGKLLDEIEWTREIDPAEFSKDGAWRNSLEQSVGIGLGVFDMVIIDEAHKSRGAESGLTRLLENVIVQSDVSRRVLLTATPVELDVSQWHNTLSRLCLSKVELDRVQPVCKRYSESVVRLRQTWRSSQEARDQYNHAAKEFEETLSPYVLRRDKREDPDVQLFATHSGLPINAYREEKEILVETSTLELPWRKAVCAAEALSVVTRQSADRDAKRVRLTLGNGHGIAALLDEIKRDEIEDQKQQAEDDKNEEVERSQIGEDPADAKREQRARWWLNVISRAFDDSDASLFYHPAILKCVEAIEQETRRGEKVLVFGRFTRPMKALVLKPA